MCIFLENKHSREEWAVRQEATEHTYNYDGFLHVHLSMGLIWLIVGLHGTVVSLFLFKIFDNFMSQFATIIIMIAVDKQMNVTGRKSQGSRHATTIWLNCCICSLICRLQSQKLEKWRHGTQRNEIGNFQSHCSTYIISCKLSWNINKKTEHRHEQKECSYA